MSSFCCSLNLCFMSENAKRRNLLTEKSPAGYIFGERMQETCKTKKQNWNPSHPGTAPFFQGDYRSFWVWSHWKTSVATCGHVGIRNATALQAQQQPEVLGAMMSLVPVGDFLFSMDIHSSQVQIVQHKASPPLCLDSCRDANPAAWVAVWIECLSPPFTGKLCWRSVDGGHLGGVRKCPHGLGLTESDRGWEVCGITAPLQGALGETPLVQGCPGAQPRPSPRNRSWLRWGPGQTPERRKPATLRQGLSRFSTRWGFLKIWNLKIHSKSHVPEKNLPELPFWFHFWIKMSTTSPLPHLDLLQPSLALQFCLARTALHSKLAMNLATQVHRSTRSDDGSHFLYPWSMLWMFTPMTGVHVVLMSSKLPNEKMHKNTCIEIGFHMPANSSNSSETPYIHRYTRVCQ